VKPVDHHTVLLFLKQQLVIVLPVQVYQVKSPAFLRTVSLTGVSFINALLPFEVSLHGEV
jgi:hypothetical protein